MKNSPHAALRLVALLLFLVALTACSAQSPVEPATTPELTVGPRLTPTATEDSVTAEDTASEEQQELDAAEQTAEDDACLTCHADAETLQVLAVEEESGESLSSGEG